MLVGVQTTGEGCEKAASGLAQPFFEIVVFAVSDHVGEAPGQGAGCGKIRNGGFDPGHGDSVEPREMIARRRHHAGNAVALIKPSPDGESGDTLSATVRALNSAGAVSRVLSADIPSLNGKPAQFFELFQESYLRELRTTAGDGIAQTELVPGTVSSGFAVSYLPRITGPGEVLVRLFASLRDRPSFTAFTRTARRSSFRPMPAAPFR